MTDAEHHAPYDVVIVGGGPAGLSAALTLGRARRRVLLCDAGPRRNAAAAELHNFVTRDGTPPDTFRVVAREQLARYPGVEVRDTAVRRIEGESGDFHVALGDATVHARRIIVCTGMVDTPLPIPGFEALWGRSIFQCPYCHGWEVQDRRWGVLVHDETALDHLVQFAAMLLGWTSSVQVLCAEGLALPETTRTELRNRGIAVADTALARLDADAEGLTAAVLTHGARLDLDVLFAHPPQQQTRLVDSLDLALDDGFIRVDPQSQRTSRPGIYAAGDATTRMQSAILGAAAGSKAAAAVNVDLALDPPHRETDPVRFWDGHYRRRGPASSGLPSAALARRAEALPSGRALELGCGNGDDSVWLAGRGWTVVATDISTVALEHALANAERRGVADRISFERHDLEHTMPEGPFDLVSATFLHSPVPFTRADVLSRAAREVAIGGTLLVVGHGSRPPWANAPADTPFWSAQETWDALALPGAWEAVAVEDVEREATGPDGQEATVLDAVLVLRRTR